MTIYGFVYVVYSRKMKDVSGNTINVMSRTTTALLYTRVLPQLVFHITQALRMSLFWKLWMLSCYLTHFSSHEVFFAIYRHDDHHFPFSAFGLSKWIQQSRSRDRNWFFLFRFDANEYNCVLEDEKHKLFWRKNFCVRLRQNVRK